MGHAQSQNAHGQPLGEEEEEEEAEEEEEEEEGGSGIVLVARVAAGVWRASWIRGRIVASAHGVQGGLTGSFCHRDDKDHPSVACLRGWAQVVAQQPELPRTPPHGRLALGEHANVFHGNVAVQTGS
eukprot:SAG31_NODE_10044_length_1192_cov_1.033852_2_plen_127_part_00